MTTRRTQSILCALVMLMSAAAHAQNVPPASLRFVENRGQIVDAGKHARPDILFTAQLPAGTLYLRRTGLSYVFVRAEGDAIGAPAASRRAMMGGAEEMAPRTSTYRMDMELVDANPAARIERLEANADCANFYLAHCPQGITGVRSYSRVVYHEIYPHVDLVYHVNEGGLKYDFVVHPGGRVADIRMRYVGARDVRAAGGGAITVTTPLGEVTDGHLAVYTEGGGATASQVPATYRVDDSVVGFNVGSYDRAMTLVLDPQIAWSTYIGGTGSDIFLAIPYIGLYTSSQHECIALHRCASNHDTSATVVGISSSADFPTTPGVFAQNKTGPAGDFDCVVYRFSQRGTLLWSTWFGGTDAEIAQAVTVDSADFAVICGMTRSFDIPTTPGAFSRRHITADAQNHRFAAYDGMLVRFDPQGHLAWSTYVNGTALTALAIDNHQNIIVGGSADDSLATTPGAYDVVGPAPGGWGPGATSKGCLLRFSPAGARLYATYTFLYYDMVFDWSCVNALAVDRFGAIAACGSINAEVHRLLGGPFQPVIPRGVTDGWVARVDSTGRPMWAKYLGGDSLDNASDVAVDSRGNIIVTGCTSSRNFPSTANTFQPTLNYTAVPVDAFLTKYDTSGLMLWSTYYGGSDDDLGTGLAIMPDDGIWLGVTTASTDFPVTADAAQPVSGGLSDGALVQFDASGRRVWATFLGGSRDDSLMGIALTRFGVFACGNTQSSNFPALGGPFQAANNRGPADMFMSYYCDVHVGIDRGGHATRFCEGDSIVLTATPGFDRYRWSNGATTRSITVRQTGSYSVVVEGGVCTAVSDTVPVVVFPLPHRTVLPHAAITICSGDSINLSIAAGIRSYRWSTGDTTASINVRTAGRYSVLFTDFNGCSNYSDTVTVTVSPLLSAVVTAAGPLAFCDGGSVVLDAGPGGSGYQWSTGEASQRITVTKAGTYSVRIMNSDGCWGPWSNTIKVTVFANPTVGIRNLLPTTFCEGDSTILVAKPSTFAAYQWSNGATTPSIVVKREGLYTLVATDSNGCTATERVAVTVTPSPHPKLSLSGPVRFCRGDSVVISATGFLQYQWSNGSNASGIVVKEPGKYFVTVMGDGGCYGTSDTATVEVMPLPLVAITGPIRVCPNTLASYSVPATSRTAYTWSVTSGGALASGAGTSMVTVQWGAGGSGVLRLHAVNDSTGCSADTSITVTIGSSLVPAVTANRSLRLCTGDSVTLDAGLYATYLWSTGATTRTVRIGAQGRYTVRVADAKGCSGTSDTVDVTLNAPPQPVIAVPNGGVFCVGDSIVLDAGAGHAAYLWSNGFTSRRITLRATASLSVTVTDTNGCTGTSPVVQVTASPQTPPVVNGPVQVCRNSTVTYTTPATAGSTYQWNVTGGALLSGQGSASIRVGWAGVGSGRIDLVETTSLGCTGASPGLDVTIGDHLVPLVTPSGTVALCPGSALHLDAGAGYASYLWSSGETSQTIDVTSAGVYTVTVADSSGCSGTSAEVTVVAKAAPVPAIAGGPLEFCEGGSVALTADAGYARYAWSKGETAPVIVVRTAGSYSVTVTDVDGCAGTSKPVVVIVHPLPAKPLITRVGDLLNSTPEFAYQWVRDGLPIAGATQQQLQATAGGSYHVIVTNAFGCSAASDPLNYRSIAAARAVMLDTIGARVGERVHLVMRVVPALSASDNVHGYHAELRFDPNALFIHDVISPDRAVTGDAAVHSVDAGGLLTVDRAPASPALVGGELFRVELEGLVTGRPLDVMTIEKLSIPEVMGVSAFGNGLVILSGCEIGTSFGKVMRIDGIRPNPVREELVVRYRLPAGRTGMLRLSDAAGREMVSAVTQAGTGEYTEMRMDLSHVSSGVYLIELRDGAERSAVPVVIAR